MNHIKSICKKYNITNYTIKDDGVVDVNGSVYFYDKGLYKLPLKFGKVTGNFSCAFNNLTSLSGCPKWVGGDFFCHGNKIKELNGPDFVYGDFIIDKSIVGYIDERYEINNDFEFPRVINYNFVNKLIKRGNNINSILKNNI
tara:strand:+ start:11554 stop:11979 length:426 start_codon:yes stop_codon:yes gene_type:complete